MHYQNQRPLMEFLDKKIKINKNVLIKKQTLLLKLLL